MSIKGGGKSAALEKALIKSGAKSTNRAIEDSLKKIVCKEVFLHMKFVQNDDLYVNGTLSKLVRKKRSYSKKDWPSQWEGWAKK